MKKLLKKLSVAVLTLCMVFGASLQYVQAAEVHDPRVSSNWAITAEFNQNEEPKITNIDISSFLVTGGCSITLQFHASDSWELFDLPPFLYQASQYYGSAGDQYVTFTASYGYKGMGGRIVINSSSQYFYINDIYMSLY